MLHWLIGVLLYWCFSVSVCKCIGIFVCWCVCVSVCSCDRVLVCLCVHMASSPSLSFSPPSSPRVQSSRFSPSAFLFSLLFGFVPSLAHVHMLYLVLFLQPGLRPSFRSMVTSSLSSLIFSAFALSCSPRWRRFRPRCGLFGGCGDRSVEARRTFARPPGVAPYGGAAPHSPREGGCGSSHGSGGAAGLRRWGRCGSSHGAGGAAGPRRGANFVAPMVPPWCWRGGGRGARSLPLFMPRGTLCAGWAE